MKKYISIISFVLFPFILLGQLNDHQLYQPDIKFTLQNNKPEYSVLSKTPQVVYKKNENSIKLDSAIMIRDGVTIKEICTYGVNGELLSSIWKRLYNGNWFNEMLISYTYDEYGNTLTYSEQIWDYNNNLWVMEQLITYTYDSNSNISTRLNQYNNGQSFVNDNLYTYTYNSDNYLLTNQIQKWINDDWENTKLLTNTYDDNNDTLTYLKQHWTNEAWLNFGLTTYSYDTDGNMLTEFYQSWLNNSWLDVYLYTNTYDDNGNHISYLQQYFNYEQWINQIYITYSYDENGNLSFEIEQEWVNNTWKNFIKKTNTYDNYGNRLSILWEAWVSTEEWKNNYRSEYTYDINNNCKTEIHTYWDDDQIFYDYKVEYEFLEGEIDAIVYKWEGEAWIESYQGEVIRIYMDGGVIFAYVASNIEIYYSGSTGIEEQIENSILTFYPNPTRDQLTVSINKNDGNYMLELFNQAGQMVKSYDSSSNLNSTINIRVGDLPPGLYFLKATNRNKTFMKKLIISP